MTAAAPASLQSPGSLGLTTKDELAPMPPSTSACRQRWSLRIAKHCSWIHSPLFLVMLQLASLGLVVAWFVHVRFFVDADTVAANYSIRLSNVKLYNDWGIAVFVVIPFVAQFTIAGMCINLKKLSRCLIGFTCISYVLMIAVGHGLGAIEAHSRRANEAVFAAEFNRYFCSLRTMRVCLDGDEQSMLTLVGRGNDNNSSVVLRDSETVTKAAFVTWRRCSQIFMGGTFEVVSYIELDPGTYVTRADVADKILSEYAGSLETDAWCGEAWVAQTSKLALTVKEWLENMETALPPEANLAHPAPYASNTHLFAAFTGEWAKRMQRTDLLLGAAVGCLLLTMWCWSLHKDEL